jgi:hypothetical protein
MKTGREIFNELSSIGAAISVRKNNRLKQPSKYITPKPIEELLQEQKRLREQKYEVIQDDPILKPVPFPEPGETP